MTAATASTTHTATRTASSVPAHGRPAAIQTMASAMHHNVADKALLME